MCLAKVFSDDEMAEYLEAQPEVIEVWKVAWALPNRKVYAPCICFNESIESDVPFPSGIGIANNTRKISTLSQEYWSGYHSFAALEDAEYDKRVSDRAFLNQKNIVVKCLIKKEWITTIGEENWSGSKIVIITSQAVFPHYPETEARWEDLPKEEITEAAAAENETRNRVLSPRKETACCQAAALGSEK